MIKSTDEEAYYQVIEGKQADRIRMIPHHAIKLLWDDNLKLDDPDTGRGKRFHRYIIAVDWAVGSGWTVMIVADRTSIPWKIVNFVRFRGNQFPMDEQFGVLMNLRKNYNEADIIHDVSGYGKLIQQDLGIPEAYPFEFTGENKGALHLALKNALLEEKIKSPFIPELNAELSSYTEQTKRNQDCVMALGMLCYDLYHNVTTSRVNLIDLP